MLNIHIIAVGKIKESFHVAALEEYQKRLTGKVRLTVTEIAEEKLSEQPGPAQIEQALAAEGRRIRAALPPRCFVVPLCVEGNQMASEHFSVRLFEAAARHKSIAFIIGSSYGLCPAVKKTGHLRLSLSDMTFPHQLFRVMLMEQIYRAVQIESGAPYHK